MYDKEMPVTITKEEAAPGSVILGLRECHALWFAFSICTDEERDLIAFMNGGMTMLKNARSQLFMTEQLVFPATWNLRRLYRTVAKTALRRLREDETLSCSFCGGSRAAHIRALESALKHLQASSSPLFFRDIIF